MKPDDIPQDVWDAAEIVFFPNVQETRERAARAIMVERERCAKHLRDGCTINDGEPVDHAVPEILHAIREGLK